MTRVVENRGHVVLGVGLAMLYSSTVFVFLRLVSRAGIVKKVMLDDYFIIIAWVIAFGMTISVCHATKYGLGHHDVDIADSQRPAFQRLNYTFTALYNPALMATKSSILLFFLTLAKQQRVFTWAVWATLFIVNAAGVALTVMNVFQCRPMSAVFDFVPPPGSQCTDMPTFYLSSAPVNIITDLIILLLPMPVLRNMRLPRKQKWLLYITFGFGIFVTAVDVVRINYLQTAAISQAEELLRGPSSSNPVQALKDIDLSWDAAYSFLWSVIEVNVGIMVACVPGLKPLVFRFVPQLIRDRTGPDSVMHNSNATMSAVDMAAAQRIPSVIEPPLLVHGDSGRTTADSNSHTMSFQEFLDGPEAFINATAADRAQTGMTDASAISLRGAATNYDFVSMTESKAIVYMSNRESIRPIAEVTLLFFLWGFSYGLLGALNIQIQTVARNTVKQAVGIHSAYYVGYFFGPLAFGRLVLKKWGFRACYVIGLIIYGTGTLMFWPAAVRSSWPMFIVTNFIIGMGLSTIELAANPFIALCGPPEYAETRLNISQGFVACGTVFANTLAKKALFKKVLDAPSLIGVQWTYLALSLFAFILAFVYYALKIPEATSGELEDSAEQTYPDTLQDLRRNKTIWVTLGLAAFAQFCYVGGQEILASVLNPYVIAVSPGADPVNYGAVSDTLFAVSRFLSAFLGLFVRPRVQLAFFFGGAILFSALAMNFSGLTAGAMIMCVFFFEGPLFALIYAMPLRALGKYTNDSSALLTAAISGGSFFPAIMHVVSVKSHEPRGVQYSLCVAVAAFAFGTLFPIYVNLVPKARCQVDTPQKPHELRERPKVTLSAMKSRVEAAAWKEACTSTSHNKRSSKISQRIGNSSSEQPTSARPKTLSGLNWGDTGRVSTSPSQPSRESVRPAAELVGTPIVTDFGAVDFGKYGRPPC